MKYFNHGALKGLQSGQLEMLKSKLTSSGGFPSGFFKEMIEELDGVIKSRKADEDDIKRFREAVISEKQLNDILGKIMLSDGEMTTHGGVPFTGSDTRWDTEVPLHGGGKIYVHHIVNICKC